MSVRKLELIAEKDGKWIKVSNGSQVHPEPRGKPIIDIKYPFEDSYHVIRRHAKRQKLWQKGIAYDVTTEKHWIFDPVAAKNCELLSGHLYKI